MVKKTGKCCIRTCNESRYCYYISAYSWHVSPELISKDTVEGMKQGSVIIDLAAGTGQGGCGNCPLTQADQVIEHKGVTIVGYTNLPSLVSHDASVLFAKNVYEFLKLLINSDGQLEINYDDELLSASLMTREGKLFNERKVNI